MPTDLLSRATRRAFREQLTGWTLREIDAAFSDAGIARDSSFNPSEPGQRRRLIEQFYNTVDFTRPDHVRKLIEVYQQILNGVAQLGSSPLGERAIDLLRRDGFAVTKGLIASGSARTRTVFDDHAPSRNITEITRRDIFEQFEFRSWHGRLDDVTFLSRLYDLSAMPSFDSRFESMVQDIGQHRELNRDWSDDWVFYDERLDLLNVSDENFVRFLSETVHPAVRPNRAQAEELVRALNALLVVDGWRLVETGTVSGRRIYKPVRILETVGLPDAIHAQDVLSDAYVQELSSKCSDRMTSGDLEGAVTVARTLLEAVLNELETRLAGGQTNFKGDLPRQFKVVAKLLKMDDQRPELDDRFKDVVRGLVTVVSGLAPLRNSMSDGHARARRPALHHVRMIVNASRTVSTFMVESYEYQRTRDRT